MVKHKDDQFHSIRIDYFFKGLNHKKVIEFDDMFSLVVKMSSIHVVLGLVTRLNF